MSENNVTYNIKYNYRPPDVISFYNNEEKVNRGFLIIDNLVYNISAGGIRMLPDVTPQEVYELAETMSYKFAVLDLPIGGAKAGIIDNGSDHDSQVNDFAYFLKPFVQSMTYSPGADMGTSGTDVQKVFSVAGINELVSSNRFKEKIDGIPFEDVMTGYGVAIAAKTTYDYFGTDISQADFSIEGFGKVGMGTALQLSNMGAKITGISNVFGSIYDPNGFDVKKLLELRLKYGDDFIKNIGCEILPRERLFEFKTSGIVLGTRPYVISNENYNRIQAEFVIEAANIPITDEAEQLLFQRNKKISPDLITNSGGVLSELIDRLLGSEVSNKKIFQIVGEVIRGKLTEIYRICRKDVSNPKETAMKIARSKIRNDRKKGRSDFTLEKSMSYILSKLNI